MRCASVPALGSPYASRLRVGTTVGAASAPSRGRLRGKCRFSVVVFGCARCLVGASPRTARLLSLEPGCRAPSTPRRPPALTHASFGPGCYPLAAAPREPNGRPSQARQKKRSAFAGQSCINIVSVTRRWAKKKGGALGAALPCGNFPILHTSASTAATLNVRNTRPGSMTPIAIPPASS